MTYLLIDNSNTRTKFVLSSPEALLPERYMVPTREVSGERLDEVLAGVRYDAAVVCSVVPRVAEELKNWIVKPCHFLSCDSRLGVGIDYPHPRQIGADRLANAVGAAAYYGYPCVVVDFGTAVSLFYSFRLGPILWPWFYDQPLVRLPKLRRHSFHRCQQRRKPSIVFPLGS